MLMGEKEMDNMLPSDTTGQNITEGNRRKSYSEVVTGEERRKARVFVGDSIVRKMYRALSKGDDVVGYFPGANIEAITERVEKIMGPGNGGSILVHVCTNNAEMEGTTVVVKKY